MKEPNFHRQQMPAYLDREVSSQDRDRFGHAHLAAGLRGLIEEAKHRPPYSVGLLGKWGTGKSTVKSLYLNDLSNDEIKNRDEIKRRKQIFTITFNAWKYGGETDIRKSLFRHIFLEIGGSHEEVNRNLFKTVAATEFRRKSFKALVAEFFDQYALGLLIVSLFGILFFVLVGLMALLLGLEDPLEFSASVFASAGVVIVLAQKFFSSLTILSARAPIQITSPPSQTIDEFEDLFITQVRRFKCGRSLDGAGKPVRRIVVFVDDLDRLTADEMVSGLDGIRSLIEMASHQMPDDIGIVFVISCDEERVADALSKRHTYAELPAAVSNIQDARRYLDRIFQFRLEIPPFPKRDMRSFAQSLLETDFPSLMADLKGRDVDIQELVDRAIHPAVQSPRNAIQIVNLFAQSWWLANLRERGAVGTENPGGLGEGVISKHPLTLAIVSVIRTDFPDFYQSLQKKPRTFDYFIDQFIHPEPLDSLPSEIREELSAFAADASVKGRWEVKPQHRGLRQFMSHIQDVRRPYSLQPFLTLSQDPVSRRHGDKAVPIEEALRTADVAALLDAVGLTGSASPLSSDFGTLLADLIDDLRAETPTIQDNVAFTVSLLDERIPEKDRRRVLGLVLRRTADSDALRWRIGPSKLRRFTSYADSEELRALGRSLIEDIAGDETKILLPSQEPPSLREARELTEATAALILDIMEKQELPLLTQTQFGQWLLRRIVRVGGRSDQVPMSWLEEKLSTQESVVLPLIQDDYPRVVADELGRDKPESLNLAAIASRVAGVFDHLFEQGTQTRESLWGYLRDFAALRQSLLVELAASKFLEWQADADPNAADSVFAALGARLENHEEDDETWSLANESILRQIFTDLAENLESLGSDSVKILVGLAGTWSMSPERAQDAARLYSVIVARDSEQGAVLSQEWAKRFFTDLPKDCQRTLLAAANRESTPRELRRSLASGIGTLRSAKQLDEHQAVALSRLLREIDESALHASPFTEQLTSFIDDLLSHVADDPADYAISKATALSENLNKLPRDKAQQLLNSFAGLQPYPSILAAVYDAYSPVWPMPEPEVEGGFDFAAQVLFNAGVEALAQLGQADEAAKLLESLDSLHRRAQLEHADNQDRLVAGAYSIWPKAPKIAEAVSRRYPEAKRTPEQLAGLVSRGCTLLADGENDSSEFLDALLYEVGCVGPADIDAATIRLLAEPPQEGGGSPDPVLAPWAAALARKDPQRLVDVLTRQDTTDDQAVRLYHRVLENTEQLSDANFFAIIRDTLSAPDGRDKTADAIVSSIPDLAARKLRTDGQRRALCEIVLSVFGAVPMRDRKAALAQACTNLGLKNVIRDRGLAQNLSEDDKEIIEKFTGKIRS